MEVKMSVVINSNYGAVVSRKNLLEVQQQFDRTVERLSSGQKTIYASDDAAGVAIAGRMEAQIRGLTTAIRHAKDGQSMAGTAEASMQEVSGLLQRMREIAVHASSGIASSSDKDHLNLEMSNLVSQVENISTNSKFNNNQLLRGAQFTFYTDIDISGSNITTAAADMAVTTLGVSQATVGVGSGVAQSSLHVVITAIDQALETVDTKRADLGAISNRFDHIVENLQNVINNTKKSKSTMIDADFSSETTKLTTTNILQQGGNAMLANANAQKKLILTLFNQ
jgi:flagellin